MMKYVQSDDECVVIFIYRNFFSSSADSFETDAASDVRVADDASLILLLPANEK